MPVVFTHLFLPECGPANQSSLPPPLILDVRADEVLGYTCGLNTPMEQKSSGSVNPLMKPPTSNREKCEGYRFFSPHLLPR